MGSSAVEASGGWEREDELDLGGAEENDELEHGAGNDNGNGVAMSDDDDDESVPVQETIEGYRHAARKKKKYAGINTHDHGDAEATSIPDDTQSLHVRD